jgi:hypothetical protein
MTQELGEIFFNKRVPGINIVDYTAPRNEAKLEEVFKKQKK